MLLYLYAKNIVVYLNGQLVSLTLIPYNVLGMKSCKVTTDYY